MFEIQKPRSNGRGDSGGIKRTSGSTSGSNFKSNSGSKPKSSSHRGGGGGGYKGASGGGYKGRSNSKRRFGGGGGNRRKSPQSTIDPRRYIAKADENVIAPEIYDKETVYTDYSLEQVLQDNIKAKGYVHPTKIQSQTIPLIMEGKDILGLARTGSGKTAAFLIPMINKILLDRNQRCLIIVPTRELAGQIQDEFTGLSKGTGLGTVLVIGGASINRQVQGLRRNPHIVVGTPGRLKDLENRRAINLSKFNNIVLDEVDRMLDMGFIADIRLLISKLRDEKQTLFFSATMSNEAERVANTLLSNPIKIQTEAQKPGVHVDQDIVPIDTHEDKISVLHRLLEKAEVEKTLVFARTKRGADNLSKKLLRLGLKVDSIHGDKSQSRRDRVISKFRDSHFDVLVATDVVARGIDIPDITHVINYDEPATFDDYIHRIGRTGRIGRKGNALTFIGGGRKQHVPRQR